MPLLELEGASKSYPGVRALDLVDLGVERGEVHAVLGENGAGKSTLMKIVAGSVRPDAGRMNVEGSVVPFGSPEAARSAGIGMVYQDLSLVPGLSIAENVLLGRWPKTRWGMVDWEALLSEAGVHLEEIGLERESRQPVRQLGMAERQLVEVAKALSIKVKVLLLDEPTSALSDREASRLFDIIKQLRSRGVGVVYVSHRLPEVLAIADRVTVLRDGRLISTVKAEEVDEAELARMMVGREVDIAPARTARERGPRDEVVLRAEGLGRPPRLRPINLELRAGEVVGVFGLMGSGRTRFARALFGMEPATEGTLEVGGHPVRIQSPSDAIDAGIGYLGEDRSVGIVPRMTVSANVTLASLDRISRGPFLDFDAEQRVARRFVDDLAIRTALDRLAETLSGGNQQKLVLARWLCSEARILILDDPTRGIDVGAKEEVYRLVRRLAEEGVAVLYLTSEIREARSMGDRILIMSNGRIVGTFQPDAPEEQIMAAAGGARG
jgi:ribose transport system ATP-binding protein